MTVCALSNCAGAHPTDMRLVLHGLDWNLADFIDDAITFARP